MDLFKSKTYTMVDDKSKTSLIRHIQKKIYHFMKINNVILVLLTHIMLLSSFPIYFSAYVIQEVFPLSVQMFS